MGFMQSYKRLDNLCKDMNQVGITGYIAEMQQIPNGDRYVPHWQSDYQKLHYYRHIRNQIAHETDATEEMLCSSEDIAWIEGFYQQILDQSDPLAVYHKAMRAQKNTASAKAKSYDDTMQQPSSFVPVQQPESKIAVTIMGLTTAITILAILLVLLWK